VLTLTNTWPKTILNEPLDTPSDLLESFRASIELAFKRSMRMQDKKQNSSIHLTDALLECFSSLSQKCRDEELADLVYFVLDLYQFHGVPIATAEVDIDQVVIDLRTALEEHAARCIGRLKAQPDSHTFLVLDKNVAGIPWESIPVLRGRSISRIPSVDFLLDRVHYCQQTRTSDARPESIDRIVVDPRKTYYVLNPSGDLKNTEGRFIDWLRDMKSLGWEGIVGRAPSELQLSSALTRKDLVMYVP
jgi:separase